MIELEKMDKEVAELRSKGQFGGEEMKVIHEDGFIQY